MARTYRIAFATVELMDMFGTDDVTFEEGLADCWEGSEKVTRHRRVWRVSAPHRPEGRAGVLTGRIGFVRDDELSTLNFDEVRQDFVRGAAPSGAVVPFAIDLRTRSVVFQLVPGLVRPTSFTGALQSILNQNGTYRWRVRPLVRELSFQSWRQQVERVTEFRFTLQEPNPHYHDDRMVKELIEEFEVQTLRVAGTGQDVNSGGSLFRQALDHVLRNYGRGIVRGEVDGDESEWRSTNDGTVPYLTNITTEDEEEVPEEELVPLLDDVGDAFAAPDDDDYFDDDEFTTP